MWSPITSYVLDDDVSGFRHLESHVVDMKFTPPIKDDDLK